MKAGQSTDTNTQTEAIRRTKQLLAACEPKTDFQQFAHTLFKALLLAHKAGEQYPGELLAMCFITDHGEDIGEPPNDYDGWGYIYPQTMIANLELGFKDIARIAEATFNFLKRLARSTFESARVLLELKAICEDLERQIHTGEVPAFAMCVIKEMSRCPKEALERINEIAAQPGKGARKRQAVTQSDAAALCGKTLKTIQRWEKGAGTPEGYPGRGDAVALGAWAARRKEAAKLKRGLTKMTSVRDMDRATQKKQHSDWQADMRRRGTTRHRQSDY